MRFKSVSFWRCYFAFVSWSLVKLVGIVTKNITVWRTWAATWAFALFGRRLLLRGPGYRNGILARSWRGTQSLLSWPSMASRILWVLWWIMSSCWWCTLSIVSRWRHALLVGRHRWMLRLRVAIGCRSALWITPSMMPCSWWYPMAPSHLWRRLGFHLGWGSLEHWSWDPSFNCVIS